MRCACRLSSSPHVRAGAPRGDVCSKYCESLRPGTSSSITIPFWPALAAHGNTYSETAPISQPNCQPRVPRLTFPIVQAQRIRTITFRPPYPSSAATSGSFSSGQPKSSPCSISRSRRASVVVGQLPNSREYRNLLPAASCDSFECRRSLASLSSNDLRLRFELSLPVLPLLPITSSPSRSISRLRALSTPLHSTRL